MEKELTILDLDKSVIQINPLMEAKKYMNVTEMRLFVLGLLGVKPHITDTCEYDLEFRETLIPANQLTILLGDNYGKIANIKNQLEKAYDSKITLNYKDGGFEFKHIYDIMKYEPERGLIIKFDNKMKPYILEIVGQQYTKYKVKALFSLTSAYAWRILELLFIKQGYFKKGYQQVYVEYEIEKLREMLNVKVDMYKRTTDFRKNVLDKPIEQINERTDYYVWYESMKLGRRIKKIKIYMKLKHIETDKKEVVPPAPADDVDVAKQEPLQLASSSAVTKSEDEKDYVFLGYTAEEIEAIFDNVDWDNIDWSQAFVDEQKPIKEEIKSAPTSAITEMVAEEKNKIVDGRVGERLQEPEWTEEQQSDYDNLLRIDVWADVAKQIVNTYDHARIERNYKGVMQDHKKGTIANLPAVVRKAIENDNYKGVAEEKRKLFEREQASKKAKYEKAQQAEAEKEAQRAKEQAELQEMEKIREKYTPEELNQVMEELKLIYQKQDNKMSDDIINRLKQYGITHNKFIRYTKNMFSFK